MTHYPPLADSLARLPALLNRPGEAETLAPDWHNALPREDERSIQQSRQSLHLLCELCAYLETRGAFGTETRHTLIRLLNAGEANPGLNTARHYALPGLGRAARSLEEFIPERQALHRLIHDFWLGDAQELAHLPRKPAMHFYGNISGGKTQLALPVFEVLQKRGWLFPRAAPLDLPGFLVERDDLRPDLAFVPLGMDNAAEFLPERLALTALGNPYGYMAVKDEVWSVVVRLYDTARAAKLPYCWYTTYASLDNWDMIIYNVGNDRNAPPPPGVRGYDKVFAFGAFCDPALARRRTDARGDETLRYVEQVYLDRSLKGASKARAPIYEIADEVIECMTYGLDNRQWRSLVASKGEEAAAILADAQAMETLRLHRRKEEGYALPLSYLAGVSAPEVAIHDLSLFHRIEEYALIQP